VKSHCDIPSFLSRPKTEPSQARPLLYPQVLLISVIKNYIRRFVVAPADDTKVISTPTYGTMFTLLQDRKISSSRHTYSIGLTGYGKIGLYPLFGEGMLKTTELQ